MMASAWSKRLKFSVKKLEGTVDRNTSQKNNLQSLVNEYCDCVVEGDKATFLANKKNVTLKIFSPKKGEKLEKNNVQNKILEFASVIKKLKTKLLKQQNLEQVT